MQSSENTSAGIRIRISDLLFALQKRWLVIVALTIVGLVLGLVLSAITYVQSSFQSYEVGGSFAITTLNANGTYINNAVVPNNNDYHLAEDMMDAVKYVIRSDHVMNEVINSQELLGYTTRQLKNAISLSQYNATQIIEMKFVWRNADEGVSIWNAVVDSAAALLPQTLQLGTLAVINEPEAVLVGVGGTGSSMPVLLALLGFFAGVGYAVIELLMRPTLNNVRDVESMLGLEMIGQIPWDGAYYKKKTSLLVQEEGTTSPVQQSFSAASYILRNRLGTKEKHHCFYVTSATLREGKSTVAANLAIQLSDMEHRTLLIDFDTRNPNLGALFLDKVDYARSLNALYRGEATEEEAITTLTGYLDLLPTVLEHNVINIDSTIVELIERLKDKYEYVIMDAPPVGMVSDTLSLNQIANTVLYVVGYDQSTIPEIQSALEKLDKSGIRVLGCVVNGVQSVKNMAVSGLGGGQKKRKRQEKKEQDFGAPPQDETLEALTHLAPREEKEAPSQQAAKKQGRKRQNDMDAPPAAPSNRPRSGSVLEDLMVEEAKDGPRTDQETVEELLRIGVSGQWGEKEETPREDGNEPTDEA